mgnify:CR=1 FL=1
MDAVKKDPANNPLVLRNEDAPVPALDRTPAMLLAVKNDPASNPAVPRTEDDPDAVKIDPASVDSAVICGILIKVKLLVAEATDDMVLEARLTPQNVPPTAPVA